MEPRINLFDKGRNAVTALSGFGTYLAKSLIEQKLLHLISFRLSQINGCAFCLDMHSKDLRDMGETEQRLYGLSAWRDTPYFTDRERAAFAWAEAVNKLEVSDRDFADVCKEFSEEEIIDLTIEVTAINTYNRLNVAFRTPAGSYVVGQFKPTAAAAH